MSQEPRPQIVAQLQAQRNYQYLRYAILALFLVALGTGPTLLNSESLSVATVGYFGMALSVLCFVMDIRNYWLFVDEERDMRSRLGRPPYSPPRVTFLLSLFYLTALLWFAQFVMQRRAIDVVLTSEAMQRLSRDGTESGTQPVTIITSTEKLVHLQSGWTKVTRVDGVEILLKNEEIRAIRLLSLTIIH